MIKVRGNHSFSGQKQNYICFKSVHKINVNKRLEEKKKEGFEERTASIISSSPSNPEEVAEVLMKIKKEGTWQRQGYPFNNPYTTAEELATKLEMMKDISRKLRTLYYSPAEERKRMAKGSKYYEEAPSSPDEVAEWAGWIHRRQDCGRFEI